MSQKWFNNIDLQQNELQNGVIQNLAADPTSGKAGQIYYNTVDKGYRYHNGTAWVSITAEAVKSIVAGDGLTSSGTGTVTISLGTPSASGSGSNTYGSNSVTDNSHAHQIKLPDATETAKGVIELATDAEAETGTDTTRAINAKQLAKAKQSAIDSAKVTIQTSNGITGGSTTPGNSFTLSGVEALTTAKGVVQLATQDEVNTGTNAKKVITPATLGKGRANGVASLDANSKIITSQLPDFIMGQVLYGGNVEAETQQIAVNSVISELSFDTSSTLNVYNDFVLGSANTTLIKVGEVQFTKIQNGVETKTSVDKGLKAQNLDDPPQAELAWFNPTYNEVIANFDENKGYVDGVEVSLEEALGDIIFGGTVVYRDYSDYSQKQAGWLVSGLSLDEPLTVTGLNKQDVWGNYISQEHIIATLSNNATNKLGVSNNSLNLTNDTTNKTGYVANEGIYYIATTSFSFAGHDFKTGDWLISTGNAWTKVDNTDAVKSVNGQIGDVNITKVDSATNADTAATANKVTKKLTFLGNGDGGTSENPTGAVVERGYDGSEGITIMFPENHFSFSRWASDTAASLSLKPTGVTTGTYNRITVDGFGRVTAGENVAYSQKQVHTFSGNGNKTSFEIAHTLGSDVVVQVYLTGQTVGSRTVDELVMVDTYTANNTVTLVFATAPTSSQTFKVIITG